MQFGFSLKALHIHTFLLPICYSNCYIHLVFVVCLSPALSPSFFFHHKCAVQSLSQRLNPWFYQGFGLLIFFNIFLNQTHQLQHLTTPSSHSTQLSPTSSRILWMVTQRTGSQNEVFTGLTLTQERHQFRIVHNTAAIAMAVAWLREQEWAAWDNLITNSKRNSCKTTWSSTASMFSPDLCY